MSTLFWELFGQVLASKVDTLNNWHDLEEEDRLWLRSVHACAYISIVVKESEWSGCREELEMDWAWGKLVGLDWVGLVG